MATFTEQTFTAGVLVQRRVYDDVAATLTTFDGAGVQTAQRALTAAEIATLAAQAQVQNGDTLRGRAQAALTANATYLALGSPTNAQVAAQVQTLTRECSALVRLALGQLDSTAGT